MQPTTPCSRRSCTRRSMLGTLAAGAAALIVGPGARPALADPPSKSEVKGAANVSTQQVQGLIASEGDRLRIVDARRPGSFEKGRIAKAVKLDWRWSNITQSWSFDTKGLGGDRKAPLVIYGQGPSDGFAALAVEKAVSEGYANVMWLRGGFAEWVAANGPVAS